MSIKKKLTTIILCMNLILVQINVQHIAAISINSTNTFSEKQKIIDEFKRILESEQNNKQQYSFKRIIVKFVSTATESQIKTFENQFVLKNKQQLTDTKIYSYELSDNTTLTVSILENMNKSSFVEYVEPDYTSKINSNSDNKEDLINISKNKQNIITQFKNVLANDEHYYSLKNIIVKFVSTATESEIKAFENQFNLKSKTKLTESNIYSYQISDTTIMSIDLLENINKVAIVEYAEPDYASKISSNLKDGSNLPQKKQNVINEFKKVLIIIALEEQYFSSKKVIVKFVPTATKAEITKFENQFKLKNKIELSNSGIYSYEISNLSFISLDTLIEMNKYPIVEYAEPDYIIKTK